LIKRDSYLFRLTPFIGLVGSSEYSVSYKSAMGFGVINPIVLKGLEGCEVFRAMVLKRALDEEGILGNATKKRSAEIRFID